MTTAKKEADRIWPHSKDISEDAQQNLGRYRMGFRKGAAWQAKQPVEISEEKAERGYRAYVEQKIGRKIDDARHQGTRSDIEFRAVKAAIEAALGGSDE